MKQTLSALALKHEAFVLALLSGMTAADAARKAGYGRKNINIRIVAWELLQRSDIQRRLREVAEATTDEAVMTLVQRKIVLSEIGRARLIDYQDEHGVIRPLEADVPNPAAIESVEYRWDPIKKEAYPWRIKLRDPVDAIVELCKLDNSHRNKKLEVSVAPITSVAVVENARTKLAAIMNKLPVRVAGAEDGPTGQEEASEKASR